MSSLLGGFQHSSQIADVTALFRWLDHADGMAPIQQIKRLMLEACPISTGDRVLDVGCGVGHEVQRMAQRVGPEGRAVGIDRSEPMIAEARRRAVSAGLPSEYLVADARHLELASDMFELCRAERVLRYIERPEQAVQEMVRVVRPGGRVVIFDFDADTIVDAPDPPLVRRIAEVLDAAIPSPWVGRQLFRIFKQVGLTEVSVVPHAAVMTSPHHFPVYRRLVADTLSCAVEAGQIDASDVARWWALLEHADREGVFFTFVLGCIVTGRKP